MTCHRQLPRASASTGPARRRPDRGPVRRLPAVALGLAALATMVTGCGSEPHGANAAGVSTLVVPAPTTTVDPRLEPLPAGPATVLVVGDSVILGAKTQVPTALPGWTVAFDAKVSRRIQAGITLLQSRKGPPPRVAVIHLCTNWGQPGYGDQIDRAMTALKGVDRVVWVTCTPWRPEVAAADADIAAAADRYPNLVVVDWAAISATPGYTYNDHLHLKTAGAVAMAGLLARAIGPAPTA